MDPVTKGYHIRQQTLFCGGRRETWSEAAVLIVQLFQTNDVMVVFVMEVTFAHLWCAPSPPKGISHCRHTQPDKNA